MPEPDSPEDPEAVFVLWPTIAIENSHREIHRLRELLQRLMNALAGVSLDDLAVVERIMLRLDSYTRARRVELAETVRLAGRSITDVMDILAELDPLPDDEGGNDA